MLEDEWANSRSCDCGSEALFFGQHFRSDGLSGKAPAKQKERVDGQPLLSPVLMTKKMLEMGRSANGGWNAKQLVLFGVFFPLVHGWQKEVIGTVVDISTFRKFLALRGGSGLGKRGGSGLGKYGAAAPSLSKAPISHAAAGVVIYEKMICMGCERVTTTEDRHVRRGARVLCAECGGMITLLHQHEKQSNQMPTQCSSMVHR